MTLRIVRAGLVGALYVALVLAFAPLRCDRAANSWRAVASWCFSASI